MYICGLLAPTTAVLLSNDCNDFFMCVERLTVGEALGGVFPLLKTCGENLARCIAENENMVLPSLYLCMLYLLFL